MPGFVGALEHGKTAGGAGGFLVEPVSVSVKIIFHKIFIPRGESGVFARGFTGVVGFFAFLPGGGLDFKPFYAEAVAIFARESVAEFVKN